MEFKPFEKEDIKKIGDKLVFACFGKDLKNSYWDVAKLYTLYPNYPDDLDGYYWVMDNDLEEGLDYCLYWAFLPNLEG